MSFYDGLNEYATTKEFLKASYSDIDKALVSKVDAAVSTSFGQVISFYSALGGDATLVFFGSSGTGAVGNFEFEVLDNDTPVMLSYSTISTMKYTTLPLTSGHTYKVKVRNNVGASQISVYLNGTIADRASFFIKELV